ncbi:C39 family peptidase [Fictibacillus sp. S7]|uniref:C39 family peptidase n=1 Tax=Fictibacillus sp. S7 TaxID=2212476 RepID=UPI0013E98E29|nr:C39 family peptidase [Fictibacillus sp. S7]
MNKRWCMTIVVLCLMLIQFPNKLQTANASNITKYRQTFIITPSIGNIRSGPGTQYKILTQYKKGTNVQSKGYVANISKEKWYQIEMPNKRIGWASSTILTLNKKVLLNTPLISQMPELPRGCEVTSLAMMLQYTGINVSKMTLAEKIKKDPTPYSKKSGRIYFGNPNTGFVGNMYTFNKPGYGVYHKPIAQLANLYLPNKIIDFSGSNFEKIYKYLDKGTPIWAINNVMFNKIPSQYWKTWHTPSGKVNITMKEHSVLITGYDAKYIYFNDPLTNEKNRKIAKRNFKAGWEQMGKQAITYKK